MFDGIVTLVVIGFVIFFGSIFGFISFFSRGEMRRQLDEMRAALRKQALDIEALKLAVAGEAPEAAPSEPETRFAPERPIERVVEEPIAAPPTPAVEPPPQVPSKPQQPSFEERLTSRWLVWLGALTIALGGVFLVKFSIDYGLITPEMRVIFGFLLGVALVAGGEWLRRGGASLKIEALRGSYVPPALTAAGLFLAFASTYAAFALYQMLSPLATFLALAALAVAAIVLSIWHGRGVALLGVLGGFVTPLLIATDQPSAWALFSYLAALVVALVTLIRFMQWYELLWLVLAGIGFWIVAWLGSQWMPGDIVAIGVFFVVTAAAFCAAFWDAPAKAPAPGATAQTPPFDLPPALIASLAVVFAGALAAFDADGYGTGAVVVLAALTVLQLAIAARAERLASLAATSTILVVATFLRWPSIAAPAVGDPSPLPGAPNATEDFLWTIGAFAATFAVLGFVKIWRGERTLLWAWLSAATPLVLFALAYARVLSFGNDTTWAAVAVALALLALVAVERCLKFRDRPGMIEATGAYSTAVIAALSLALVMVLEEAWLTVALSLLLPALAWTDRRLDIPAHRSIALVVGAVVIVRLVLNPDVLSYEAHAFGRASWVLYGYGVPALACFVAARIFAEKARDHTVAMLEAAALLFTVVLVFFEIRALTEGSLVARRFSLFEASLHTLAWGIGAYGLERVAARMNNVVASYGWRALLGLAALNLVVVHMIVRTPLSSGESVGLPLLNVLLLAYAAPAALALAFALHFRERGQSIQIHAAIIGIVLVFVWISLETMRSFRGPVLSDGIAGDAELYALSVVWLGYAGVLLVLAIRFASTELRWASLVVLFVTVGKVFLSDMAALTGLWRVASFIGLGLTLVGIGYLYQRYVFPNRQKPGEPAPEEI